MSLLVFDWADARVALNALQATGGLLALGGLTAIALPTRPRPAPAAGPLDAAPAPGAPRRALAVRYGSALATVTVFFAGAYLGGLAFGALMTLFVAIGLYEFFGMCRQAGHPPFARLGGLAGLGVVLAGVVGGVNALAPAAAVGFTLLLAGSLRAEPQTVLPRLALTALGLWYVAWQAAFMVAIRDGAGGFGHFVFFFAVIQMADVFAFFGGRAYGKRPLAGALSPGKTVEGALTGLVAAVATACVFSFALPGWPMGAIALLGAALAVTSVLGDLVASSFKRAAGLKDFGRLLPEQGGLLDRFDGYLFSAPLAYYLFGLIGS